MARISCEMTEVRPRLYRRHSTEQEDREMWALLIQTDAGLLDLEITPEQGRAVARGLVARLGWGDGQPASVPTKGLSS
jgi:hypothetical protein